MAPCLVYVTSEIFDSREALGFYQYNALVGKRKKEKKRGRPARNQQVMLTGSVLAGTLGMLFFYKALSAGKLSRVLPIAFTSPVYGALLGMIILGEEAAPSKIVGIILTFLGVALLTFS